MSKNIVIKEEDLDNQEDQSREEIIEEVNKPEEPKPIEVCEPIKQKADSRMRMRELYKCDLCGKYLTKKTLNYSHQKSCTGNPNNQKPIIPPMAQQIEEPPKQVEFVMKEETPPSQQIMTPVQPQRQIPIYQQMAMERRLAHLQKIDRLKQFIV